LTREFFSGASENENVCDFLHRSDGLKGLMKQKPAYITMFMIGASLDENLSGISPGENS